MIVVKEFGEKVFASKGDLFKALRENKHTLIAQKKAQMKHADAVLFFPFVTSKSDANKSDLLLAQDVNTILAKVVINTTNLMDSHNDVHFPGIWNKYLKENKHVLHLQEHKMTFDHIISDEVKASVQMMKWKDLGFDYPGETQALVFESTIKSDRNPFMYDQYKRGFVKQHSVGMRYHKLELAINSESKWDVEEKEVWDKYIDQVVNKDQCEIYGYFWAVTEAAAPEGSAVVKGSNPATPTLSLEEKEDSGAGQTTPKTIKEPSKDTLTTAKTHLLI